MGLLSLFSWETHKCCDSEGLGSGTLTPSWWEYKVTVFFRRALWRYSVTFNHISDLNNPFLFPLPTPLPTFFFIFIFIERKLSGGREEVEIEGERES